MPGTSNLGISNGLRLSSPGGNESAEVNDALRYAKERAETEASLSDPNKKPELTISSGHAAKRNRADRAKRRAERESRESAEARG
jgi:hypothetical protein